MYVGEEDCPKIGDCHCNHHTDGLGPCCWCGALPDSGPEDEDPYLVFLED